MYNGYDLYSAKYKSSLIVIPCGTKTTVMLIVNKTELTVIDDKNIHEYPEYLI